MVMIVLSRVSGQIGDRGLATQRVGGQEKISGTVIVLILTIIHAGTLGMGLVPICVNLCQVSEIHVDLCSVDCVHA